MERAAIFMDKTGAFSDFFENPFAKKNIWKAATTSSDVQ